MSDENFTAESILQERPRLMLDEQFTFHCGRELDCFTQMVAAGQNLEGLVSNGRYRS